MNKTILFLITLCGYCSAYASPTSDDMILPFLGCLIISGTISVIIFIKLKKLLNNMLVRLLITFPLFLALSYFSLGFTAPKGNLIKATKIRMSEINKNLDMFHTDCGEYPDKLSDLITQPNSCSNWGPSPYIRSESHLEDSWGNPLKYLKTEEGYSLVSLGEDGKVGGLGKNKDLSSDDL